MARDRSDLVGREMGALATDIETNLRVEWAVDITADCPALCDQQESKILLLYATSAGGALVQLVDCFADKDEGAYFHWSMQSLDALSFQHRAIFEGYAAHLGLTPEQFRCLIHEHAPENVSFAAA